MNWSEPPKVPAIHDIVRSSAGHHYFVVEAPAPYEPKVGHPAPLTRSFEHPLLAPYRKFLESYNPMVGTCHYFMIQLPSTSRPQVLFSLSIADHQPHLRDPTLLPGPMYLFPGFKARQLEGYEGKTFRPDHVSVKEAENDRLLAYTRGRGGGERPERPDDRDIRPRVFPELPPIHLLTTRIPGVSSLHAAGVAMRRIDEKLLEIRDDKPAFLPDPTVRNHWVDRLFGPPRLLEGDFHLWSSVFLVPEPPTEEDIEDLVKVQMGADAQRGLPEVHPREMDGTHHIRTACADLSNLGVEAEYDMLLHMRGLVPGRLKPSVAVAAFPSALPVNDDLEEDLTPQEFRSLLERA